MKRLFVRPLDTQFFRSGLPFDAGTDSETMSVFPPFPRTIYGAFRTTGMLQSGASFPEKKWGDPVYGDNQTAGTFRIKGPVLSRLSKKGTIGTNVFLPFPLDLMVTCDSEKLVSLSPINHPIPGAHASGQCGWDLDTPDLKLIDIRGIDSPFTGEYTEDRQFTFFLPFKFLTDYLLNRLDGKDESIFQEFQRDAMIIAEERTGIARDNRTRTNHKGMLYRVTHFRLRDTTDPCGFYVELENCHAGFPDQGMIKLGGESRSAFFTRVTDSEDRLWWKTSEGQVVEKISETGRFKAFFITPAFFARGSLPDPCEKDDQGKIFLKAPELPVKFRLCGLCAGSPVPVGGYDISRNMPKAIQHAVPAGSVYFFEPADEARWKALADNEKASAAATIMEKFNFQTWCSVSNGPGTSNGSVPGNEGFGLTLIGGW